MSDQILKCVDCAKMFTWTDGEQAFYTKQGYSPPKRCSDCRADKRARNAARQQEQRREREREEIE